MAKRVQLTPFLEGDAKQVGKNRFRKHLLPAKSIVHKGETLDFTPEYLTKLVSNFTKGKLDQVPFMLVNDDNEHVDDPERFRGETVGMEVAGDGLYVTLDLSEDGAKLVEKNPRLGISARIDRTDPDDPFIEHVAGTVNPVVKGLKPWEKVSLSDSEKGAEVLDLTEEEFAEAGDPSPTPSSSPVEGKLSDADRDTLVSLAKKEGAKDALIDAGISDEEVKQVVEGLIASAAEEDGTKKEEPVAALSKEQRESIELANRNAKSAADDARAAREELAQAKFERERDKLIAAGVPPADIELAEPVLKGGSGVIELSNGAKVDAHDVITKLLEQRKGTIDFSTVGVGAGDSDDRDPAVSKWVKGEGDEE